MSAVPTHALTRPEAGAVRAPSPPHRPATGPQSVHRTESLKATDLCLQGSVGHREWVRQALRMVLSYPLSPLGLTITGPELVSPFYNKEVESQVSCFPSLTLTKAHSHRLHCTLQFSKGHGWKQLAQPQIYIFILMVHSDQTWRDVLAPQR